MKRDDFLQSVDGWLRASTAVMRRKSHDYASDDDALSNFKFVGFVLNFAVSRGVEGPALAAIALRAVKWCREIELHGKDALNEPIDDTFTDDINYTLLHRAIIEEEKMGRTET